MYTLLPILFLYLIEDLSPNNMDNIYELVQIHLTLYLETVRIQGRIMLGKLSPSK